MLRSTHRLKASHIKFNKCNLSRSHRDACIHCVNCQHCNPMNFHKNDQSIKKNKKVGH